MNKLFTKIAGISLGIAMAIGVGVGIVNKRKANRLDADNDISVSETTTGTSYTGTNFDVSAGGATYSSYYKLGSSTLTSKTSYNIDGDKDISYSITTRKFGGPSDVEAVVNLSLLNGSTTVATASYSPSNTNLNAYNGKFTVTGDTFGVKFVIKGNGTSGGGKGVAISSISFTATSANGGGGGDPDPGITYHSVTFKTLDGTTVDTKNVAEGGTVASMPSNPAKAKDTINHFKYTFGGWYSGIDPLNPDFASGTIFNGETIVNNDLVIYAKFNESHYNVITFNTNGGNSISSQEVDDGGNVTKPNDPYKDNKFFDNWYESPLFEGSPFNFGSEINSDKTLNANWLDIPISGPGLFTKVTRTEDLIDGGKYLFVYENGSLAFNGNLSTLDASSNTINVVFDGLNIKRDNNTSSAWFVINKTTGYIKSASSYYVGRSAASNGMNTAKSPNDFNIYANTISFDGNGNVVVVRTIETSTMTLRYNPSSGQERFRYFTSGQQSIQLYMFTSGYRVTFVTNSSASIDPIEVLGGNTITLPDNPTKDADANYTYTFEGWYTDEELTIAFNPLATISSNLTLYAKYTAEQIDNPNAHLSVASSFTTLHGSATASTEEVVREVSFEDVLSDKETISSGLKIGQVNLVGAKGTHASSVPQYYSSGTSLRVYIGNTLTFSASHNIKRIEFKNGEDYADIFSTDEGDYSSGIWTGSATNVEFSVTAKSEITYVSVTYDRTVLSSVALRFGATMPIDSWAALNAKWPISDYGVMLFRTTEANLSSCLSVEDYYNAESALDVVRRGSGAVPNSDGEGNYVFTVKVSVSNVSTRDAVFCAAPFIVAGGTYYFLEEQQYSIKTLAQYYLTNGGSALSNEVLSILAGE